MAKSPRTDSRQDAPRRGHARAAGELVGDIAGTTFKRFGFVQGAVVSRWAEIVGARYAKVSTPESVRSEPKPIPRELGEGLREIADPGLRACLESLAARIESSDGAPALPGEPVLPPTLRSIS